MSIHRIAYAPKREAWFLLAFLIFLSAVAPAQASKEIETVETAFKVFPLNRKPIEGLFYRAEENKMTPVSFASRHRSVAHEYRGPPEISFYRKLQGEGPDGPRYEAVATASLLKGGSEPLLFFLPTNRNPSGPEQSFRVLVADDSEMAFPYGHFRVLNASGAPLHGKIGDRSLSLNFDLSPSWRSSDLFRRGESWVNLGLFVKVRENTELVYANQLTFDQSARSILVVLPPRRENSLRVSTFLLEEYEPDEILVSEKER